MGVSYYLGSMLWCGDSQRSPCVSARAVNDTPMHFPRVYQHSSKDIPTAQCGHLSEDEALCKVDAAVRYCSTLVQAHHAIDTTTRSYNTVVPDIETKNAYQDACRDLVTNTTSKTEHATLDTPAKTLHKLSITTERSMLHWHVTAP